MKNIYLALLLISASVHAQRPNIVFILADDLGYGDVGVFGQTKIHTPNIDALAKEGTILTNFYAGAPVCSPSRGVLITGKNTGHATIRGNMTITGGIAGGKGNTTVHRANILPDEFTIGNLLQQSGYTTGMVGKWHIDGFDTTATPLRHGFDYFFGWLVSYPSTYESTYWPATWYRNGRLVDIPENQNGNKGYYTSQLITDDAIRFMESHKHDDKPFFVMVNHSNPHSPLDAPPTTLYDKENWTPDQKVYAAMVSQLDSSVGKIRNYLIANGLDKNTIVIFTSDNGPRSEPTKQLTDVADFFQSNGPLRGYKRDMTEGGIREPTIFWNKQLIPAGVQIGVPGYFADLMPTFAGIAASKLHFQSDGIDLYPYITGKKVQKDPRFLYWEFFEGGYVQGVRYGKWKAIIKTGKLSLYDLDKDIHEDHDVAAENPSIVNLIREYLKTCRVDSPYWPVNE
jgi:arylsulfatase A-like enzyme